MFQKFRQLTAVAQKSAHFEKWPLEGFSFYFFQLENTLWEH